MEIIDSIWFTEHGSSKPIGLVLVNITHETKAYIGTGDGLSQLEAEHECCM